MRNLLIVICLLSLASCAPIAGIQEKEDHLAYLPRIDQQNLLSLYQPLFLIEKPDIPYNRIGTPHAEFDEDGKESISVDPTTASIYAETRRFKTERNLYTNLIYRVHFSETPWGLIPFQIAVGKNVGLFIIVTLNSANLPVLYTTVHTCGCYLAFIPTSYLPHDAYPTNWPEGKQIVYSKILPAQLNMNGYIPGQRLPVIFLENASHRVKGVWLADLPILREYPTDTPNLLPMATLEELSLKGTEGTTSFYESSGARTGYVKGSHKPLERLLMSWWALDWRIGEDKKLGENTTDPPIFFTSLKPWARDLSDMRDFPTFLSYWGWNL